MNVRRSGRHHREACSPISMIMWTGSKRRQAAETATYHEPFPGGGSALGRLLDSPIRVDRHECSNSYAPLVGIWDLVKNAPEPLIAGGRTPLVGGGH